MNKKIDIVITMAGLGSRFRKVGYTVPKYMIEVKGKTLFEWSIISLEGCKKDLNQYIFITMKNESVDVKAFIENKCSMMGIDNYHIILLDYLTDGQATTAKLASKFWNKDNGLLIYKIDTYVEPGEIQSDKFKGDGFIPCFHAEGDHWSFVRLDSNGKVAEIKEKQRISNYCTLGAYYFKTCQFYESLYEDYYGETQKLVNGEKYVAPLYNYLLSKGGKIYISNIDSQKVHVLGTPEELESFRKISML